MAGLHLKQKVKLRNEFHFVVTDGRTGEVKQEAFAYNLLTDMGIERFMAYLLNHGINPQNRSFWPAFAQSMQIGTGDMALNPPAANVNVLANFLSAKSYAYHATEYDAQANFSSSTVVAVWQETDNPNTAITEVGLSRKISWESGTHLDCLVSHAAILDSEGNPIAIQKGEWDVITVYAKVIVSLSAPYGNTVILHKDSANGLLRAWQDNSGISGFSFYFGRNNTPPGVSDSVVLTSIFNAVPVTVNDTANKRIRLSYRCTAAQANHADGIWEVGFLIGHYSHVTGWRSDGVFRSVMPVPGVIDGRQITGDELGTGDGEQTIFSTTWKPINSGLVVYLDGVPQPTGWSADLATGQITFDSAPGVGVAVTADYYLLFVPKDGDHVFDMKFDLDFADGNI
jgi:hypothetical protein